MNIKKIHQFSAGFNPGDAISNEMSMLQDYFRGLGFEGDIYSENIGHAKKKDVYKFSRYQFKQGDFIVYHHSIHSAVYKFLKEINPPMALIYHNVTPYEFFKPYDLKLAYYLKKGREELDEMRDMFLLNFADSEFNAAELIDHGFCDVKVLPIVYDFEKFNSIESFKNDHKENKIIFVGRIAPNKKHDDLIKIAKILKDYFHLDFKLFLLGHSSKEMYLFKEELNNLVEFFDLKDYVIFSDFIDDDELIAHYKSADLFLCMSEHEGFCVPLIEAMGFEVPIIAFDAGAVRGTLNGAGILFFEKDFLKISEYICKILSDAEFKNQILRKQNSRFQEFKSINAKEIIGREILKLADGE